MNTPSFHDLNPAENAEWREGTVREFLGLSPAEEALVDLGLVLSNLVRDTRRAQGFTQAQLAEKLGTRQPNIVRLEQSATSLDLVFHALFVLGVAPHEIADALMKIELRDETNRSAGKEKELVTAGINFP